jgi:uncharacterized protein YraI
MKLSGMRRVGAGCTRAVTLFATVAVAVAVAVAAGTGTALAATGTVHTDSGEAVNVHSGPHTSAAVVGSVANGASVSISCQTYGDTVTGKYGTSDIWDKIPSGYITDTYVYTGSDGLVAPLCSGTTAPTCSAAGLGDPNTCAQAVAWAKAHESTADNPNYYGLCDNVMALAYGFSASGSETAYDHWLAVPAKYKHAGETEVPAGGLAFFGGGDGHVMISIGGGKFVSTDIGGNGTFTVTTIAAIKSAWGKPYLGWTQPWFQVNH